MHFALLMLLYYWKPEEDIEGMSLLEGRSGVMLCREVFTNTGWGRDVPAWSCMHKQPKITSHTQQIDLAVH